MKQLITLAITLLIASFSAFAQDTIPVTRSAGGVYNYVDQMPEADYNVNEYLAKAINYPIDARDRGIAGRVILRFIITETGDIDSIMIMKPVYPSIAAEAIRVVKNMPRWKPGRAKGAPVKVYFTLPIKFSLGGDRGWEPPYPPKGEVKGTVYETVDKKPEPGFNIADFISEYGVYPVDAKEENIQGSVTLKFIVNSSGDIDSIYVIKSLYPSMDALAMWLVDIMPYWKPGVEDGKFVNVRDTLSLRFTLGDGRPEDKPSKKSITGPILTYAEQMPEPGVSINSYISSQVTSSNIEELVGTKGKVVLRFIVTSTGDLDSFRVVKSLNPLVDTLAMTILDNMPSWSPAINAGKAVNVYHTVAIPFNFTADTSTQQAQKTTVVTYNNDTIYSYVDQMPEPGYNLNQYLSSSISYPEKSRKEKIEGRVVVRFIISKNGKIENITVQQHATPELDEEAVRVIKAMPDWKPARHNNEPVGVYFTLPIKFALN